MWRISTTLRLGPIRHGLRKCVEDIDNTEVIRHGLRKCMEDIDNTEVRPYTSRLEEMCGGYRQH